MHMIHLPLQYDTVMSVFYTICISTLSSKQPCIASASGHCRWAILKHLQQNSSLQVCSKVELEVTAKSVPIACSGYTMTCNLNVASCRLCTLTSLTMPPLPKRPQSATTTTATWSQTAALTSSLGMWISRKAPASRYACVSQYEDTAVVAKVWQALVFGVRGTVDVRM